MSKKTQIELFLELAEPDENGVSRWVAKTEFVGKYADLMFQNGWSWGRSDGALAKKFVLERFPKYGAIEKVRTAGFNTENLFSQNIRSDIKNFYKDKNCVMLGVHGTSVNTRIEVDHKDGRKNDMRVSDMATQRLEDFQPLCKAANDVKYDPVEYRKQSAKRIAKEASENTTEFIMKKLYGSNGENQ